MVLYIANTYPQKPKDNIIYDLYSASDLNPNNINKLKTNNIFKYTIKFDNKSDLLEAIGLHEDDMWFRDMVMSSYSHYEFNDSYTIEEDFKEGYIFEYDLTEENFDTLKSIAKMVLPNEKVDFEVTFLEKCLKTLTF